MNKPVITSEDAELRDCVSVNRKCCGKNCMAWIEHTYTDRPAVRPPHLHKDREGWTMPEIKYSGKGFCGLIDSD